MPSKQRHIGSAPPITRNRARELRKEQTPAEKLLWIHLRDRRLGGFKFRRQHPVGRFIADFYCAECGLVVEIDGCGHKSTGEYDSARTQWLKDRGCLTIRFTNGEVRRDIGLVLAAIFERCQSRRQNAAS